MADIGTKVRFGTEKTAKSSAFISVLHSDGPALGLADELKLYGQFVGDWNTDIVSYEPDGTRHQGQGEVHFGWVLHAARSKMCG